MSHITETVSPFDMRAPNSVKASEYRRGIAKPNALLKFETGAGGVEELLFNLPPLS